MVRVRGRKGRERGRRGETVGGRREAEIETEARKP